MDDQRLQILLLDDGGIKGLFSAAILAATEDYLTASVVDNFDCTTGISTGGTITLGLASGMRPMEIVAFYLSKEPSILGNAWGLRWLQHWTRQTNSQTPLRETLQSRLRDTLIGDCTKRFVGPSYNPGDDDVHLFRTPQHEKLRRGQKTPLWRLSLAPNVAANFSPCGRHIDCFRLIYGGAWSNNPSTMHVVEAYGAIHFPRTAIKRFRIGTTAAMASRKNQLDSNGRLRLETLKMPIISPSCPVNASA
jgi:patatin-like phospholipase/acyl hydrolase